ncbi:MAG: PspA/IM30 family protein [Deltaproteobacteria bacterium]|nr:PspA/IM30 family protein [Deltaproteobacteria bacterium]
MGIFGRLNRVIKSNVNELIDKMSDPAKEIDLLITEMEQGIEEAREEVRQGLIARKRAELDCGKIRERTELWQGRAETALRAGEEQLARQALQQRMDAQRELAAAEDALERQDAHVAQLKDAMRELQERLKEIKLRKDRLKQRARAAKDGGSRGIAGSEAFDRFDALEARIEAMHEAADVAAAGEERDLATEAAFRRLEQSAGNSELDKELEKLKERMALPPGADDEVARLKRQLTKGDD